LDSTIEEQEAPPADEQVEFDAHSEEDVDSAATDEPADEPEEADAEESDDDASEEVDADEPDDDASEEVDADEPDDDTSGEAESDESDDDTSEEADADESSESDEGVSEEEEDEEEVDDGRRWYVIHSYSGYENKVKRNLLQRIESMEMQDQIFEVIVPTIEEMELHDGKRRTVSRRVFPGYILVQMIMNDDSWYVVRNTPGVTGFVGMGNKPTPLSPQEVGKIMQRIESDTPQIRATFTVGQKVRIVDGPFAEFVGSVDEVDEARNKLKVLVSFFGRETPVELDYLQVEKV